MPPPRCPFCHGDALRFDGPFGPRCVIRICLGYNGWTAPPGRPAQPFPPLPRPLDGNGKT